MAYWKCPDCGAYHKCTSQNWRKNWDYETEKSNNFPNYPIIATWTDQFGNTRTRHFSNRDQANRWAIIARNVNNLKITDKSATYDPYWWTVKYKMRESGRTYTRTFRTKQEADNWASQDHGDDFELIYVMQNSEY